jgi:hypothetical protein
MMTVLVDAAGCRMVETDLRFRGEFALIIKAMSLINLLTRTIKSKRKRWRYT